jgi:MFS family permease
MKPWWAKRFGKIILFAIVAVGVAGVVIMFLWNALVPDLFHGPQIGYWQAVALLILVRLLMRVGFQWSAGAWRHDRWRQRLEARVAAMSPEEREKFKAEWRRCGYPPEKSEPS